MPEIDEQIHVLDAASMMRLWLADKVERGAITRRRPMHSGVAARPRPSSSPTIFRSVATWP